MEYLIGILLAVIAIGACAAVGLARDRGFFPTMMMCIATYYVLFAAMSGAKGALVLESLVAVLFLATALVGFRTHLGWVAAALIGHGLFDLVHHFLIDNPGVPPWWPGFCMAFDVVAGIFLVVLILRPRSAPVAARPSA